MRADFLIDWCIRQKCWYCFEHFRKNRLYKNLLSPKFDIVFQFRWMKVSWKFPIIWLKMLSKFSNQPQHLKSLKTLIIDNIRCKGWRCWKNLVFLVCYSFRGCISAIIGPIYVEAFLKEIVWSFRWFFFRNGQTWL